MSGAPTAASGDVLERVLVTPRRGGAIHLQRGEGVRITDLHGRQVGDLIAVATDTGEWLSPCHTRQAMESIRLHVGAQIRGHRRSPLLRLVHDDVGQHDLMFPACDQRRYEMDFGIADHATCVDNLDRALSEAGIEPCPFEPINLFMNFSYSEDGSFTIHEPMSKAGDCVLFLALEPLVVALSACPQERTPCNGWNPTDLLLERLSADREQRS